MTRTLNWKIGFEIELMAPRGQTRRDLAERTANRVAGRVSRFFHPDSEPAKVPGTEVFENLTPGFRVESSQGEWIASFVDDLTLQADCNRQAPPKPGWYRIVSDDNRFIRLIEQQCDAEQNLDDVLRPLSTLFGTQVEPHPSGMMRVADSKGRSVAMGAQLPGERERPCEIITAPIEVDHYNVLSSLLDDARALGFFIPRESATHFHYDAKPLRSAKFIARFVEVTHRFGTDLKRYVGTNSACVRLGPFQDSFLTAVRQPDFINLDWNKTRAIMIGAKLTKYCDFNLVNMVNQDPAKDTLEIRILPGMMDADLILDRATFFENLLRYCLEGEGPIPNQWEKVYHEVQKG